MSCVGTPKQTHSSRGGGPHQASGGSPSAALTGGTSAATADMLLLPAASRPHLAQSARGASCVREVASRRVPAPASGVCHAAALPRVTAVALCRSIADAAREATKRISMLSQDEIARLDTRRTLDPSRFDGF